MRIGTVLLAAALCVPAVAVRAEDGAWAERVQTLYEPAQKTVARRLVRVWNPEPLKNLDFSWEPGPGARLDADGTANGRGRLTWRVRGAPTYDPKSVYATYEGELRAGRPHGRGRLVHRTGEVFDGMFVAGLAEGEGTRLDADGNRYDGAFVGGVAHGMGRLASRTGEIHVGLFERGLRHGEGETRLPGGATYVSRWENGREVGARRPLDGTVGGVLKAQAGPSKGDAAKVEIAVSVEPRLNAQAVEDGGVAYQHQVQADDIAIFPLDQQMNDYWNGTGVIDRDSGLIFEDRDWENVPAFAEVEIATTDGSRVKLDALDLKVATSQTYRKPMLSIIEHLGCVGFRPAFSVTNRGWGQARDVKLSVHFTGPGKDGTRSRPFTRSYPGFDEGADFDLREIFEEAGADTAALDAARFTCESAEALNLCKAKALNQLKLGEVSDFVWTDQERPTPEWADAADASAEGEAEGAAEGEEEFEAFVEPPNGQFYTGVGGTISYGWTDDSGSAQQTTEAFHVSVPIFFMDVGIQAECGAGYGASPEAARFQDVRFRIGQDYPIAMPLRGNRTVSKYTARLKMQSEDGMSSYSRFTVAARFADGSVKTSKPVSFYFLRPRFVDYVPGLMPDAGACYMPQSVTGCTGFDPRNLEEDGGGEEEEGTTQQ